MLSVQQFQHYRLLLEVQNYFIFLSQVIWKLSYCLVQREALAFKKNHHRLVNVACWRCEQPLFYFHQSYCAFINSLGKSCSLDHSPIHLVNFLTICDLVHPSQGAQLYQSTLRQLHKCSHQLHHPRKSIYSGLSHSHCFQRLLINRQL